MPSEGAPAEARVHWLRSQGLGFLCGQLTVGLLAVGSVVLVATREGASAGVHLDDLTAFFTQPSWAHAWLYALVAVMCLYALNTALCTVDSVRARLAARTQDPAAWGPIAFHVAFLLTLVAHAVGGVWTVDHQPVVVASAWQNVGQGRDARLLHLESASLANGRPKWVQATLAVRDGAGKVRTEVVGYNQPLSERFGSELLLLEQAGQAPRAGAGPGGRTEPAVLLRGRTAPGNGWALAAVVVMAAGLVLMGRRWVR